MCPFWLRCIYLWCYYVQPTVVLLLPFAIHMISCWNHLFSFSTRTHQTAGRGWVSSSANPHRMLVTWRPARVPSLACHGQACWRQAGRRAEPLRRRIAEAKAARCGGVHLRCCFSLGTINISSCYIHMITYACIVLYSRIYKYMHTCSYVYIEIQV